MSVCLSKSEAGGCLMHLQATWSALLKSSRERPHFGDCTHLSFPGAFCLLVSFHLRAPSSFSQPFPFPVSPHLCGWPASPPLALREQQMLIADPWFKGCLLSLLYRQCQSISGRAFSRSSSTPFCTNAPSLLCPLAARNLMAPVPFPIALPHSEAKWEPSIANQSTSSTQNQILFCDIHPLGHSSLYPSTSIIVTPRFLCVVFPLWILGILRRKWTLINVLPTDLHPLTSGHHMQRGGKEHSKVGHGIEGCKVCSLGTSPHTPRVPESQLRELNTC